MSASRAIAPCASITDGFSNTVAVQPRASRPVLPLLPSGVPFSPPNPRMGFGEWRPFHIRLTAPRNRLWRSVRHATDSPIVHLRLTGHIFPTSDRTGNCSEHARTEVSMRLVKLERFWCCDPLRRHLLATGRLSCQNRSPRERSCRSTCHFRASGVRVSSWQQRLARCFLAGSC